MKIGLDNLQDYLQTHNYYRSAHKSSRKLFEQSQKLEKVWSHVFCGSVTLSGPDSWYRKLRELIEKYQSSPVWISESKVSVKFSCTSTLHKEII